MEVFENKKIILASKSPRRSYLLESAGIPFEIRAQDVEEDYPADMAPESVPAFLAQKKAHACKKWLEPGMIVLASDSIVLLDGVILGKPTDMEDAKRILRALSNKKHLVITGVCLLASHKEFVFDETTAVYFDSLSEEEIDYYTAKYQPLDKAGAYGIQEWIGLCKILKIEGTYSNVMGLPVSRVYHELIRF